MRSRNCSSVAGRFALRNRGIVWCERSYLPCVVGLPGSPVVGMVPREASIHWSGTTWKDRSNNPV